MLTSEQLSLNHNTYNGSLVHLNTEPTGQDSISEMVCPASFPLFPKESRQVTDTDTRYNPWSDEEKVKLKGEVIITPPPQSHHPSAQPSN